MMATFFHTACGSSYISVNARTPQEFIDGHIPGAVNIDINSGDFIRQAATLDKTRPVEVYCRSGRRSEVAAEKLTDNGFSVTELDGGIISWKGELTK